MSPVPRLSVIMPAFQAEALLPDTLAALAASDLPRDHWELVVVDDGSRDRTAEVAGRWADRVVRREGPPAGPGAARNRGAEASTADWLVFVDADVRVHPDTLRRFVEAIAAHPDVDAIFGAYDDAPPAPGFLSAYRNLLHRYVHLQSRGEAETFWAGCGAVRRSAFEAVGGFDAARYPRPQIEDIDLGYRLRDAGYRVLLQPEIVGTHLKRWELGGAIRTDLFDRGIPWVRLLLERRSLARPAPLNLKPGERLKVAAVGLAVALALGAAVTRRPEFLAGAGAALLGVTLANLPLLVWFARQRGLGFALAVIPANLGYYLTSGLAVVGGVAGHLRDRALARRPPAPVPGLPGR